MSANQYTYRYPRTESPFGLGRHIRHDPASARFGVAVRPRSAIRSVAWPRRTPILDQAKIGCCVPNAGTGLLGTDATGYTGQSTLTVPKADSKGEFKAGSAWSADEVFALNAYRLVTRLDSYPGQWEPDDTGSDGLTMAKALVMLGLADVYQHAFSYAALVSGLQDRGAIIGSRWDNDMFQPAADGRITPNKASGVAGGHEYLVREFDAVNDRVWIDNSWGESWGLGGRAYMTGADLTALLKDGGDVTFPHLVGSAPLPVPPGPPAPVPSGPSGAEVATRARELFHQMGV